METAKVNIVEKSFRVIGFPKNPVRKIANAARVCYDSKPKCLEAENKFIKSLISAGHLTPFEHVSASVELTCSRATSHEIVRHRLASFNQQSQRYVDYSKEISFVRPIWTYAEYYNGQKELAEIAYTSWLKQISSIPVNYMTLLALLGKPEFARECLPNSTATTIIMTANFREWMHIFDLRAFGKTGRPHPEIKSLFSGIYIAFNAICPEIFDIHDDMTSPFDVIDKTNYGELYGKCF